MKWICNYCEKVVEKDNFIEVLEEGVEDEEYQQNYGELGTADGRRKYTSI
jgi:hypothetical protein